MKDFRGKVAVVTGAGNGIGRSMALAFAREGMNLVLVDINADSLVAVEKEVKETRVDVMSRKVDVSDRAQMAQLAEDTFRRFDRVNILCNNAGIGAGGPFAEINLEDWDWILGVNLSGAIYGIHFFLKHMLASEEECHIVNTASIMGLLTGPDSSTYHVSKFGVVALSESLFYQVRDTKVGVSVICPGYIKTPIADNAKILSKKQKGVYQPLEKNREVFEPFLENMRRRFEKAMSPDVVAQMVINSIQEKRLYILPQHEFLPFLETRLNLIRKQTLDLKEVMASMGVGTEKYAMKTYTHQNPGFSISYPGDWVELVPTSRKFEFRAVSTAEIPDVTVVVYEKQSTELNNSIDLLIQDISATWGLKAEVISKKETSLRGGNPALEGEVEMEDFDGVNRNTILTLNTIHGDSIVSVQLTSIGSQYDETMKNRFQEIAYSLVLN